MSKISKILERADTKTVKINYNPRTPFGKYDIDKVEGWIESEDFYGTIIDYTITEEEITIIFGNASKDKKEIDTFISDLRQKFGGSTKQG